MPTYEFVCPSCEAETKFTQSIHEPVPADVLCEKCGYRMIRSWGIPGVQFKGGGWASTAGRG